jgi:hypothetical protein
LVIHLMNSATSFLLNGQADFRYFLSATAVAHPRSKMRGIHQKIN